MNTHATATQAQPTYITWYDAKVACRAASENFGHAVLVSGGQGLFKVISAHDDDLDGSAQDQVYDLAGRLHILHECRDGQDI